MSAIKWALIENMVTIASTAALILGLYAMDAGGWAGFGFLLLININTSYPVKSVGDKEMKKFMIDQLTISLPGDYAPSIPALLDGAAWRQQDIDRLADSVVYHQKERDKEIERTQGRVEWVKALRTSLTIG